jgi:hypothetical protein
LGVAAIRSRSRKAGRSVERERGAIARCNQRAHLNRAGASGEIDRMVDERARDAAAPSRWADSDLVDQHVIDRLAVADHDQEAARPIAVEPTPEPSGHARAVHVCFVE